MAKKKSVKCTVAPVPSSIEEVADFVGQIGKHRRAIDAIQTSVNNQIEGIKAQAGKKSRPHEETIQQLFEGVYAFAMAFKNDLTDGGKKKTVQLPTGEILWRMTPPSISLRNVRQVLEQCRTLGLTQFIRTKQELDKEAMLKEQDVAATIKGVTVSQREEFVVKPSEIDVEISGDTKKLQKKTGKK